MKNKKLKKVDMTLVTKFNIIVSISFDALALCARSVRDFMYTAAARAAKLADAEEGFNPLSRGKLS